MAAEEGESLESLLNKATSPLNRDEDWDFIMAFCDQINKELEGPQIAVRLLAHKIQSPQEKESLYALVVLEACVKNCGKRFHQEIGKFRFLNELIKVVSPKYLGAHMTDKVKTKVIELMYSWSKGLNTEGKIYEAYQMLKRQGIVKEDPTYVDQTLEPAPLTRPRNAVFEDEEKSKLLARLLKSKHPEDLQAANRLIKNMVKQDVDRIDKVSKRVQELETVSNNKKVLEEMMEHYQSGNSSQAERDVMKELYENLEKSRPSLFRLASDTDEKDGDGINQILRVNDEVVQLMLRYKKLIEQNGDENCLLLPTEGTPNSQQDQGNLSSLLDLDMGQLGAPSMPAPAVPPPYSAVSEPDSLLLDDGLAAFGLSGGSGGSGDAAQSDLEQLGDIFGSLPSTTNAQKTQGQSLLDSLAGMQQPPASQPMGLASLTQPSIPPQQTFPFSTAASSLPGFSQPPALGATQPILGAGPSLLGGAATQSQPVLPPMGMMGTTTTTAFGGAQSQSMFSASAGASGGSGGGAVTLPAGLAQPLVPQGKQSQQQGLMQNQHPVVSVFSQPMTNNVTGPKTTNAASNQAPKLSEIDKLGESLMKQTLASATTQPSATKPQNPTAVAVAADQPLSPAPTPPASATASPQRHPSAPGTPSKGGVEVLPLNDLFVKLETIQPGSLSPVTAYEKNGLKIVMHFGKDRPRPDVQVIVVSVMSTNSSPVKNLSFQAAVPKVMKVKLQPPSATDLPAFNPILPPTAITQVMLVANPLKENIRLKYKLSHTIDGNNVSDVGDVDNFPVQ